MKIGFLFLSGILFSVAAHAALVEDGSAFTGTFRTDEVACITPAGTDLAGQPTSAKTDFNFKGAVDSLSDDRGSVIGVAPFAIFDHGGGLIHGSSGQYISDREFLSEFLLISPNENHGQPTLTRDDYKVSESGVLTHETTVQIGRGEATVTRLCHFKRVD